MDELHVGFTGTRDGMTEAQKERLFEELPMGSVRFHHGCCLGADEQAHWLAFLLDLEIVGHPPTNRSLMMSLDQGFYELRQPRPYLDRNQDIVTESAHLFAAPGTMQAELRSGTWSTVRYARKKNRPITIIWPDGSLS